MSVSPARRAAYAALIRVETGGAFADDALYSGPFERLDVRDRALATEIVLGVLRWRGTLDELIAGPARKPLEELDPEVRTALRIGAYQALRLERVPVRAAVSESVELVKNGPKRSAAGFVNAVLRRLPEWPDKTEALERSHPAWLLERWRRRYGSERTRALIEANQRSPETFLRLSRRFDRAETLVKLAVEGVEVDGTEFEGAYRLVAGHPRGGPCWLEGRVRIQDLSSQAVVGTLDLAAGLSFLDVCAAPGGKIQQAVELLQSADRAVACDRSVRRLKLARRLGPIPVAFVAADAEIQLPLRRRFDRILVDAPCSGTGTLARNPDIKWRLEQRDLDELPRRQKAILRSALALLEPSGTLVYSTCSLEPEENQAVVELALAERPDLVAVPVLERLPGRDAGDGFQAFRITTKRQSG